MLSALDVPTLIIANMYLLGFCALVQFFLFRFLFFRWNTKSSGVVLLAWGNLAICVGCVMLLLRTVGDGLYLLSVLGGNGFILLGYYLLFLGLGGNEKVKMGMHKAFGVFFLLFLGVLTYFSTLQNSVPIRSALVSLAIGVISWAVVWVLWPKVRARNPVGYVLAFLYACHGAFFLHRACHNLGHLEENLPALQGGGLMGLTSLEAVLFTYAIGIGYLLVVFDNLQEKLQYQAQRDYLTGLYNRMAFEERAREIFARAQREKTCLSMMMLDLDHFKKINDTHGHAEGDRVLTLFAETISKLLEPGEIMARVGGEEFALLLPQGDPERSLLLGERFREETENMSFFPGTDLKTLSVTVSVGVALGNPAAGDTFEEVFRKADQALYRAKELGRNRVVMG